MQAATTWVVVGIVLIALVGGAALVWLARRAQSLGTVFRGELRTRLFTWKIESEPGPGDARSDNETENP